MDALTPNTSAFLSYLSTLETDNPNTMPQVKTEPTFLPPSAFFSGSGAGGEAAKQFMQPSPDSEPYTASASPEKAVLGSRRDSSAPHDPAGSQKRKAGHQHTVEQSSDGEDDSDDDAQSGHEDKRAHGNKATGSGRRARKSVGGEDTPAKGSKDTKAARRKEQNRAAQKAFRERREAKVKTLEDKVAELEQKSQGVSAENESLRGLLKRLQEENVALKQSAFTFSMPVGGTPSAGTGTSTPRNLSSSYAGRPVVKPPTPPHSSADDPLKSIDDLRPPHLQHRGSSGTSAQVDTPESLVSVNSRSNSVSRSGSEQPKQPPMFDPAETFNAFALGVRPEWERQNQLNRQASGPLPARSASGSQPAISGNANFADAMSLVSGSGSGLSPLSSSGSNNKSEIEALWASFYPNGVPNVQAQAGSSSSAAQQPSGQTQPPAQGQMAFSSQTGETNPYNLFLAGTDAPTNTGFTPFINSASNVNPMDRMAFRDSGSAAPVQNGTDASAAPTAAVSPPAFDWNKFNDDGIDSFLSSLSGGDTSADANDAIGDDDFSAQIQALINANTSNISSGSFGLGAQMFSPTNYLNMSPSPIASGSISSGLSPASNNMSNSAPASNYASPDSFASSSASTAATSHREGSSGASDIAGAVAVPSASPVKSSSDVVYVVGPDGKVIKPSELWIKMGMQHASEVDHLVIDDLCDQMKAKATCKDGANYLSFDDAEKMFKYPGKCPPGSTSPAKGQ